MKAPKATRTDEQQVRDLIESWVKAVHAKDYEGILAHHSADILMFDVPLPFESRGIKAYQKTWDLFFSCQPDPLVFDIDRLEVTAGVDVAFATVVMVCAERLAEGQWSKFKFRLTVGLRKIEGKWTILHEHHSIPAA
jgi:ketosteroid isomerase-like protein